MSKDKEIVEIKETIDSLYGADCAYYGVDGFWIAAGLHDAGYRKTSDIVKEIQEDKECSSK